MAENNKNKKYYSNKNQKYYANKKNNNYNNKNYNHSKNENKQVHDEVKKDHLEEIENDISIKVKEEQKKVLDFGKYENNSNLEVKEEPKRVLDFEDYKYDDSFYEDILPKKEKLDIEEVNNSFEHIPKKKTETKKEIHDSMEDSFREKEEGSELEIHSKQISPEEKLVAKTDIVREEVELKKKDHNKYPSDGTLFAKIKWWLNFITTIIMNSIIVILLLVGVLFIAYYIDVTKNSKSGVWKPPLYGAYVIVSGSMEPTILIQDAIIIKRVPQEELKIGDTCTYLSKDPRYFGVMITHRIIGTDINDSGQMVYIFKGDNNYSADQMSVEYSQIYGKVIMKIPKIGYIQYFLSSAYGWIIAIVIPCVGIITYDVFKLVKTAQKKRIKAGDDNEK